FSGIEAGPEVCSRDGNRCTDRAGILRERGDAGRGQHRKRRTVASCSAYRDYNAARGSSVRDGHNNLIVIPTGRRGVHAVEGNGAASLRGPKAGAADGDTGPGKGRSWIDPGDCRRCRRTLTGSERRTRIICQGLTYQVGDAVAQ